MISPGISTRLAHPVVDGLRDYSWGVLSEQANVQKALDADKRQPDHGSSQKQYGVFHKVTHKMSRHP